MTNPDRRPPQSPAGHPGQAQGNAQGHTQIHAQGHAQAPSGKKPLSGCLIFLMLAGVVFVAAWVLSSVLVWWTNDGTHQSQSGASSAAENVAAEPVTPRLSFEGFRAGNIISDADLHNSGAMSEQQIRDFINEWNAGCRPGADGTPCLSEWRGEVPSFPEDQYCWAFEGGNMDAASVIYRAAQACEMNPQALLVILQKEQGLITASSRNLQPFRYRSAMGYACPDHGDCDPEFSGFPRQVYYAARQFQKYRISPEKYSYQGGQAQSVPFHANKQCGSAEVFMENQATASLYNYTPHQPNQAALSGREGPCSSWGNLHFYAYWNAWFGSGR